MGWMFWSRPEMRRVGGAEWGEVVASIEARGLSGGLLDAFLLSCVRPGVVRGRELLGRIEAAGLKGIRPGEMYRILRGMEREGLVFSHREEFEYMLSRRSYGITASGEAYLEFPAESLREYREEMDRFFTVYESPLTRSQAPMSAREGG